MITTKKANSNRKTIPIEWKEYLFENQGGVCCYCGIAKDISELWFDHKTPVSRGGDTNIRNLALACPKCNMMKGSKTPEEYKNQYRAEE